MLTLFGIVFLVPLVAVAWIWRNCRPARAAWLGTYLPRVGLLFGAGLLAAGPFLTEGSIGTGEAFNYSLATADAVVQARAGEYPVLVGQSQFAWNGRVHPLRTAPYLANAAIVLDLLTGRRLGFWGLQNMVLALSLVAGVFSAYACLRRGTGASSAVAMLLAAGYGLSPPVLAAAYSMDLFMTMMTVPYLPIVVCALARAWQGDRSLGNGIGLAAGLAATWWAHPPVALWTSTLTALLLAPLLLAGCYRGRDLGRLAGAAAVGGLLAAFAFASALSVKSFPNFALPANVSDLLAETRKAFPAALLPVSREANQLGDFQLGYAGWLLAGIALGRATWGWARGRSEAKERQQRKAAWALLAGAAVALTVTLPVPGLHAGFWRHAPSLYMDLTNQWPMQRLYLVGTLLVQFAFALVCPRLGVDRLTGMKRDLGYAAIAGVLAWTGWQAWAFLGRGFASRQPEAVAEQRYRPENTDLTIMAYAILRPPTSFVNGVMDPAMEPRLLRAGRLDELTTNWAAPAAEVVAEGMLRVTARNGGEQALGPSLRLQPGQRYRLRLEPQGPAPAGILRLKGEGFFREYGLPAAGEKRGFGLGAGHNPALSLWTTRSHAVELQLTLVDAPAAPAAGWARYVLERLDPGKLPVEVTDLIPFRATTRAPGTAMLETPRLFVPGYEATVDGRPVRVRPSPEGLAMIPVPGGVAAVELVYRGPLYLRTAFWVSLAAWAMLGGIVAGHAWRPTGTWLAERLAAATRGAAAAGAAVVRAWRRGGPRLRAGLAILLVVLTGWLALAWRERVRRNECGPVQLALILPAQQTGRQQPLLTTGRAQAGAFVFVHYLDDTHVRIGLDVWNRALVFSEPIETDYEGMQEVTVDLGALYPDDHAAFRALPEPARRALKNRAEVRWNGTVVLAAAIDTYASAPGEVTPGESRIGGSSTEPKFTGRILRIERLPVVAP